MPFVNYFLSKFISVYWKTYSRNNLLVRLIENWKIFVDQNKFAGAVLMDISKAFDCIHHEFQIITLPKKWSFTLLKKSLMENFIFSYIVEIHTYWSESLTLFYSYLKGRKQSAKINNAHLVYFKYSYQAFPKDQY